MEAKKLARTNLLVVLRRKTPNIVVRSAIVNHSSASSHGNRKLCCFRPLLRLGLKRIQKRDLRTNSCREHPKHDSIKLPLSNRPRPPVIDHIRTCRSVLPPPSTHVIVTGPWRHSGVIFGVVWGTSSNMTLAKGRGRRMGSRRAAGAL